MKLRRWLLVLIMLLLCLPSVVPTAQAKALYPYSVGRCNLKQ